MITHFEIHFADFGAWFSGYPVLSLRWHGRPVGLQTGWFRLGGVENAVSLHADDIIVKRGA